MMVIFFFIHSLVGYRASISIYETVDEMSSKHATDSMHFPSFFCGKQYPMSNSNFAPRLQNLINCVIENGGSWHVKCLHPRLAHTALSPP